MNNPSVVSAFLKYTKPTLQTNIFVLDWIIVSLNQKVYGDWQFLFLFLFLPRLPEVVGWLSSFIMGFFFSAR